MLTCENITCRRGGKEIFKNLGFTLGEGGFLQLKGSNGSGKTSLLKIISGLLPPYKGSIYWHQENISDNYYSYLEQTQFIGHKNALNRNITVKENLNFWAKLSDTKELVRVAVVFFELEKVLNTPVYMLSEGWQKRVALAKLMVKPSKLWLLDEPLSNLDDHSIELLLGLIVAHYDQGGIVIMSSHSKISLPYAMELDVTEYANMEIL